MTPRRSGVKIMEVIDMKEERTCGLCGDSYPGEDLYPFDGLELCAHCLDERTLLCRHCGERIWEEDNAGSSEVPSARDATMITTPTAAGVERCSTSPKPTTPKTTTMTNLRTARTASTPCPTTLLSTTTITNPNLFSMGQALASSVWSWRSTEQANSKARPLAAGGGQSERRISVHQARRLPG